ncbi:MAG: hypothetical protein U0271_06365 [Polyangiaceae bacterium]
MSSRQGSRRSFGSWSVVAALSAGALACTYDFDHAGPLGEDGGAGGFANTTTSSSTTSAGAGGSVEDCVCPDTPAPFEAVFRVDDLSCGTTAISGGIIGSVSPFTYSAATCACSCDEGCEPLKLTGHTDTICSAGAVSVGFAPFDGSCVAIATPNTKSVAYAAKSAMTCTLNQLPAVKPAVDFAQPFAGCAVDSVCAEKGALCVPSDSTANYCLVTAVDTPCPTGFDNPVRALRNTDLTDTRDCTCSCAEPMAECATSIAGFADASCVMAAGTATTTCLAATNNGLLGGLKNTGLPTATCAAPFTALTGDVVESSETLLCCTQPLAKK